jgi:hypothetical protein
MCKTALIKLLQYAQSVHLRHYHIQQNNIGLYIENKLLAFDPVSGHAGNLHILLHTDEG